MNTEELVIVNAVNPKQFLQHIGHSHSWGPLDEAMTYSKPEVARDLATLKGGVVVPLKSAAAMKGRV